jgi:hypothetical protein
MEEDIDRKYVAAAQMEMYGIGFSGSSVPAPAPVPDPEPPPPAPAAPEAPAKTQMELDTERDVAAKDAISASKRQGRKATMLTRGPSDATTTNKGLLSYESMTGLQSQGKDKLGA